MVSSSAAPVEFFKMDMARKRKDIVSLGSRMEGLFQGRQWGNQRRLFSMDRQWERIVGHETAKRTMPAFFRRDVLWIYVQSSAWMQQLQFDKVQLLEKINRFLQGNPQVNDLRWMEYPPDLILQPREEYVSPPDNVDPREEQSLETMAENIADPDARRAFVRLWRRVATKKRYEGGA
jgi:hypothetical protein